MVLTQTLFAILRNYKTRGCNRKLCKRGGRMDASRNFSNRLLDMTNKLS